MSEYIGRINVSKDTMLFVLNSVFNKEVKESTTKENILKMMPEIYENTNPEEIIKLLPYDTYNALENLIEYVKKCTDIEKFFYESAYKEIHYLEDAMIIVMRAKYSKYNYSLNPGVIEKLSKLFTNENRKIAERYGKIERLTKGMLYSYGVVEVEFFIKQMSEYMNEDILGEELYDIFFKRLNLNTFVNYYDVKWTNTNQEQDFLTYLDEEIIDIGTIVDGQKGRGLRYKKFKKSEILNREEILWDENAKKLYDFIESNNIDIYEYSFQRMLKRNELSEKILEDLMQKCRFKNEEDIDKFLKLYMEWYNNSPQYELGGYTPTELMKILY